MVRRRTTGLQALAAYSSDEEGIQHQQENVYVNQIQVNAGSSGQQAVADEDSETEADRWRLSGEDGEEEEEEEEDERHSDQDDIATETEDNSDMPAYDYVNNNGKGDTLVIGNYTFEKNRGESICIRKKLRLVSKEWKHCVWCRTLMLF